LNGVNNSAAGSDQSVIPPKILLSDSNNLKITAHFFSDQNPDFGVLNSMGNQQEQVLDQ
jgi:hypothetical protein